MLLFEEIDKNIQFNSMFLEIHETFVSVRVRQVAFFYLRTEKGCLSVAVTSLRFNYFRDA